MYSTGDSSSAQLSQSTAPATMSRTLAVATSFTRSYYGDMSSEPESLYRFYDDDSAVIRIDADVNKQQLSDDPVYVGQQDIHDLIVAFAYNDCRVRIDSVDAVDTVHQCILIVVTGQVTFHPQTNQRKPQTFTQTFLLHPMTHNADAQDETPRLYIRNDIMRYATGRAQHNDAPLPSAHAAVPSTLSAQKSDHLSVQSTTPSPALSPAKTSRVDDSNDTAADATAKATPRRDVRKESAPVSPAANAVEKSSLPFTSLSPQPSTSPRPVLPMAPSPAKTFNVNDNAVSADTASSLPATESAAAKPTDVADFTALTSETGAGVSDSATGPSPQRPESRRNGGPGRGGRAQSRGGNNVGSSAAVTPLSWASRVGSSQPANAPATSPPPRASTPGVSAGAPATSGGSRPQTTANTEHPAADGITSPPADAGAVAAADSDGEFHRVGRTRTSRGRGNSGAPQSVRNGERGFHGDARGGADGGRGGRGGYFGRPTGNDRSERGDRGGRGGAQRGGKRDNAAPNSKAPSTAPQQ